MISQSVSLVLILLTAAVVAVPLAKRVGLGSILGYLIAGAVIGPFGAALFKETSSLLHFAEFGVVFLMFVIGLELKPARLWVMRRPVFGLGSLQMVITTSLLATILWGIGQPPMLSLVLGFATALSSTAFALQYLSERNQLTTEYGRTAFSILLFQDVAVIPALAVLPLILDGVGGPSQYPAWVGLTALVGIYVIGRWGIGHVFRLVASTRNREVFTAMALLLVLGVAALMETVGLSMALGSFLVGVLLSESEYRHELETDIEPFKGLLLGLFFISVGMTVNTRLLWEKPTLIFAIVTLYLAVKFWALFVTAKIGGLASPTARNLALSVVQGSEFAFVIVTLLLQNQVIERQLADLVILTVSLSMAVTPLLGIFNERILSRRFQHPPLPFDEIEDENPEVIVAGHGRWGQIMTRILRLKDISFTSLEHDPAQVETLRRFGVKVYYGDASRIDLLERAGAARARYFVLGIDDVESSLMTAQVVREKFPHLKVFARARNRDHAFRLKDLGIQAIERETFWSSLNSVKALLADWGEDLASIEKTIRIFVEHDLEILEGQYHRRHDQVEMINFSKIAARQLVETMQGDRDIVRRIPAAQGSMPGPRAPHEERS
ncbi:MAG: monovalent cation:proton antiporter-2 (CPA2) family protein [Bdellovibrionales bacterium]